MFKTVILVVLGAVPLIALSQSLPPEDGDTLIPMDQDREYSSAEINRALSVCLLDGDKAKGITSLAQIIHDEFSTQGFQNLQRDHFKEKFITGTVTGNYRGNDRIMRNFYYGYGLEKSKKGTGWRSLKTSIRVDSAYEIEGNRERQPYSLRIELQGPGFDLLTPDPEKRPSLILTYNAFPQIHFVSSRPHREVDKYGREIRSYGSLFKGVSIYLTKKYEETPFLINGYTYQPTEVKLNLKTYVHCLRDQLMEGSK